ncbi:MAG: hypothetical protein LV479_03580 [Methylacidiphilales bacterium]|nr:hypothetical protein [Candidatus Methylacidiphilales bacterium]
MIDPIPSDPPPEKAPVRRQRGVNWFRASVYLAAIVIVLVIGFFGAVVMFRTEPQRIVNQLLAQLPFSSSTGQVNWMNSRMLKIENVKLGDFFYADSIVISANLSDLMRSRITSLEINGGQVYTKQLYAAMDKYGSETTGGGLNWTIGRLQIKRGTILLDSPAADISIPIRLGVRQPVILHNIRLNKAYSSPDMSVEQTIEIQNVNIVSPFDPLAPVLAFPLTRVRFTYDEFWHHKIRGIELVHPTMFLGQDLFWFVDQFKKERQSLPQTGVTAPWYVDHFSVRYGQLAVNAFGQPVVHFPFFFETQVDNIRLDQLDRISAKSVIAIRRLNQDYPDYKIRIVGLEGRLYFSLPLGDPHANNVVNTIKVDEVSWNEIPLTNVSSSVTFDPNGVYGKLNGTCEGGQLTGTFEFYYTKGFTWNTDFFADKVNCQPIAEKLGGRYIDLTGTLNGKIAVQGKATEILKCQGLLAMAHPGILVIKSMKDLLDKLPPDTSVMKREALKIAIKPFQTYPYTSGQFKVDYKPDSGTATLKLESPENGQRQFDIYWHPYDGSKVANDADNR